MCNDACPGLFIKETMPNATMDRLQRQLNIMSESCLKYGPSIKMSKTNVNIFRNDGRLGTNEKVCVCLCVCDSLCARVVLR